MTGVGRRLSPHDLLESLVLPSKVITEGYAATEIETKSGETITGRIEREDDRVILLRPLAAAQEAVRTIKRLLPSKEWAEARKESERALE